MMGQQMERWWVARMENYLAGHSVAQKEKKKVGWME